MRYGLDDLAWVVIDPTAKSEPLDILFKVSLKSFILMCRGGLEIERNPVLFTEREEAEAEARRRFLALRASQAIARPGEGVSLDGARRVEILDAEGAVLFAADLGEEPRGRA